MAINKKVFASKPLGGYVYTWSPIPTNKAQLDKGKKPYYCNAIPGSQGQDWVTTYSYDLVIENSIQQRIAYVECDYVK